MSWVRVVDDLVENQIHVSEESAGVPPMLRKIAQEMIRVANPRLTLTGQQKAWTFEVTDFENADGKITFGVELVFSEDDRMPLLQVSFKESGDSKEKLSGVGASDIFKNPEVLLDLCAVGLDRAKSEDVFGPVAPDVTIEKGCEPCCKILCCGWTPPQPVTLPPGRIITNIGGVA